MRRCAPFEIAKVRIQVPWRWKGGRQGGRGGRKGGREGGRAAGGARGGPGGRT
jgi:hypothetical protein